MAALTEVSGGGKPKKKRAKVKATIELVDFFHIENLAAINKGAGDVLKDIDRFRKGFHLNKHQKEQVQEIKLFEQDYDKVVSSINQYLKTLKKPQVKPNQLRYRGTVLTRGPKRKKAA